MKRVLILIFYYTILPTSRSELKNIITRSKKEFLKNFLEIEVINSEAIFFLNTSSVSEQAAKIFISYRTACALESAARIHKNRRVYLLYTVPGYIAYERTISDEYLIALTHIRNIDICYVNLTELTINTPVEDLVKNKKIELSKYKNNYYNELTKLVTLLKFGGVYLENDMIVLKPFDELEDNFVAADASNIVKGVLSFRNDEYRDQLEWLLKEFAGNYEDDQYNINQLLTRVVKKLCQTETVIKALNRKCNGLKIYPAEFFYPVSSAAWPLIFDEAKNQKFKNLLKYSHALHLWDEPPRKRTFSVANAPLTNIARKYCPSVYKKMPFSFVPQQ